MKAGKIRELGLDEMKQQLGTLRESLFNLRFQHGTGQLENLSMLKKTRRDIARLETVIRETTTKK
ncbi:MAG: 50S ribosomal protein L29 [Thermodesulfobacteriota bacterium]